MSRPDDIAAVSALRQSRFARLPTDVLERLVVGARALLVPAGAIHQREADAAAHLDIVVSGFARAYVAAPDGRTMTVRYCRPGAILGAVSLYARPFRMPATVQCLVETEFLALAPDQVRRLVSDDPRVAEVLLIELSDRVSSFIAEIPSGAFASVRQRVARHLLDLASQDQRDARLVAHVSQSDLADAVGTSREVVVRALRELRDDDIIATARGGITVRDPERLYGARYPSDSAAEGPSGTKVPDVRRARSDDA